MNTTHLALTALLVCVHVLCVSGCGAEPTWVREWARPSDAMPAEFEEELTRLHCPRIETLVEREKRLRTWESPAGLLVANYSPAQIQVRKGESGEQVWVAPATQPLDVERLHFSGGYLCVILKKPTDDTIGASAVEVLDGLTGRSVLALSSEIVDGHVQFEDVFGGSLVLGVSRSKRADWGDWLIGYDLGSGRMTWAEKMQSGGGHRYALPSSLVQLGAERLAYPAGAYPPSVKCRHLPDGRVLWSRTCPDGSAATQLKMLNGLLLWESGSRIIQLAPEDGRVLWQTAQDLQDLEIGEFWFDGDNVYQEGQKTRFTARGAVERLLFVREPEVRRSCWIKCFRLGTSRPTKVS